MPLYIWTFAQCVQYLLGLCVVFFLIKMLSGHINLAFIIQLSRFCALCYYVNVTECITAWLRCRSLFQKNPDNFWQYVVKESQKKKNLHFYQGCPLSTLYFSISKNIKISLNLVTFKGQLILKAKYKVFIWTKNRMKIFLYFCPSSLKWVKSKR